MLLIIILIILILRLLALAVTAWAPDWATTAAAASRSS